ncbi:MAG: alpha/beta hydrolase [Gemmatimonadales bacterium]|nr:MAG: alpha/beta hydrolase [Gemmatimonadales bacterium]
MKPPGEQLPAGPPPDGQARPGPTPDDARRVEEALHFDLGVVEWGGGPAPPVVLVHGFGASAHSWRHWTGPLGRRGPVLTVDLTGFGEAPCPPGARLAPEDHAARLTGWLRSRPGPAPILVGHSLGAPVVLMTALRLEEHATAGRGASGVAGVAVVSGAVFRQPFPPYMGAARIPLVGDLLMAIPPPRRILAMGIRGIVADGATVTPELVEGYRRPLTSWRRRRAILRAARAIRPSTAGILSSRYDTIRAPVLALWGSEDPVVPPDFARRLVAAVPRGESVLLEGVGHLVPEEAPRASAEAFMAWMERSVSGGGPPEPAP